MVCPIWQISKNGFANAIPLHFYADSESVFVVHLHMALLFGQLICSGLNSRVLCPCKQYFLRVIAARNWLPCLEGRNFVHIDAVNATTLVVILYAMHNFLSHSEVREILGQASISPTFYFSTDALERSGCFVTNCEDDVERVFRTAWRHW